MRTYEFFEKYYRCVYTVSEIYEYSTKLMEHRAYSDKGLREAQGLVLFSLHYILFIDKKYIVKYLNMNYETLERLLNYVESIKDKNFKKNISIIYKEFKNEHRRIYKEY